MELQKKTGGGTALVEGARPGANRVVFMCDGGEGSQRVQTVKFSTGSSIG